jgi:NAD(P)-dependent dehydrogenase (short-subunit alcohol dehydrogenase family)
MHQSDACYVCNQLLGDGHEFYPALCKICGDFNYKKRGATADLNGHSALVTGGRLKIGFEAALKVLRFGANTVVTTRFVEDAHRRFERQPDFDSWATRLTIIPADFRMLTSIEHVIGTLFERLGKLDILINNAAQTVRRPPAFYRHLLSAKNEEKETEEPVTGALLLTSRHQREFLASAGDKFLSRHLDSRGIERMSQLILMPGDESLDQTIFPPGRVDKDGQQEDRRDWNSWVMMLDDVHLVEFLEVLYINLVAPFLLCNRLRAIMKKTSIERPSFVINVTAMEGNFYDPEKNARHVHTNMAKAGLNMMTRTAALDFVKDRIYMTSVDPGFITNEKPFPLSVETSTRRVKMAIDEVDGASRVCDPIIRALNEKEYLYGVLLKNYSVFPW